MYGYIEKPALKEKQLANHKLHLHSILEINNTEWKEVAFKNEKDKNEKSILKLLNVYEDVLDDDDKDL